MASIAATGYVDIHISSNVSTFAAQKRFPVNTTIIELKVSTASVLSFCIIIGRISTG